VKKDLPGTLKLMHIDTIFYKEELLLIFDRGFDENGNYNPELSDWHLHNKTGKGYAKQLMSETVVEVKDKRGNIKREWRKIGKNNHLLDLEVYQLAGRDLIKDQLRQLSIPKPKERDNSNKPPEGWR
jgi:phage terminase large subunit GpA-like protein